MEKVMIRNEMRKTNELNDTLEANMQEVKSGEEETLFMVEEIEAV